MPLLTVQVATAGDSVLARDFVVNTFHLNKEATVITGADYDGLAGDVATLFAALYTGTREMRVRIYKTRDPKPNYPVGSATRNVGGFNASNGPREVALCLSYYGAHNTPHQRGRMYICATMAAMSLSVRPSSLDRDKLKTLANGLAALGGVDVDWQVYSPSTDDAENVQQAWIDDEWDTVRKRGLRATTRTMQAISE